MKNIKKKSIITAALTALSALALGIAAIAISSAKEVGTGFKGSYDLTAYAATGISQISVEEKSVDITDTATFISTDEANTYTLCLTIIDVDDLEGITTHLQVGYKLADETYYNGTKEGLSELIYSSLTFANGVTLAASELNLGENFTNPYFIVAEVFTSVIGGNTPECIVSTAAHVWADNVCTVCGYDAGGSKGLVMALNEETDTYALNGIGTCKDTDIAVPSTYNGLPVTEIGSAAFEETEIKSITIPDSVTAIGTSAFSGCESLESVTFGKNSELTTICQAAFVFCYSLKGIDIPDNVTEISEFAFYGCVFLGSVTFGEGSKLTTIGTGAFAVCSSLVGITIPAGVTSIADYAFYDCGKLVEVWDLTGTDGEDALNVTAGSEGNGLVAYNARSVYTDAKADSKLSTDENGYVVYCDGTDKVLVNYVGTDTQLTIPDSITELNDSVFIYRTRIKSVIIPEGITTIPQRAFNECVSLISVTIPESVTTIGDYAFSYCCSLTSITIPAGVTSIGEEAFSGCYKLVEVWDLTGTDGVDALNVTAGSAENGLLGYCAKNVYTDKAEVGKTYIDENGYIIYDDGLEKLLLGYNGDQTQLILPDGITRIYRDAFFYNSSVTSIIIPEGVTTIDDDAFGSCTSLKTVSIPDSVTSLGSAFGGCSSLIYKEYNGAKYLGNEANPYLVLVGVTDTEIKSCEIPDETKIIVSQAFDCCDSLESVTFGANSNLTTIGANAFADCSSLTGIAIPDSVTTIGEMAFDCCTSLESVTFGANSNLTTIGESAFADCSSLTGIAIPDSVTTIDEMAFINCTSLESVTFGANSNLTTIGADAFYGCSSLTDFTIPAGVTSIGMWVFSNCSSLKSVTFADNSQLTTLNDVFYNCDVLESITFGANSKLTTIDSYAFDQCASLKNITIPASVTTIAEYAFYRCPVLESVTFADNSKLTELVCDAFCNCPSLKSIAFGNNSQLTTLTEDAFYDCDCLESVDFGANSKLTTIGDYAFSHCSSLKDITLPDSVTSIGNNAFYECTSLESINIPDGVSSIGNWTFASCESLESITFGKDSKLTAIGDDAFSDCTSLINFTLPDGVTAIGEGAFYYCSSLESLTFGKDSQLTTIGEEAFANCFSLIDVELPGSVTTIGEYAFKSCTALESVVLSKDVALSDSAFNGTTIITLYFIGTADEFTEFASSLGSTVGNYINYTTKYYYTESAPELNDEGTACNGNYWHYVDGVVTVWAPTIATFDLNGDEGSDTLENAAYLYGESYTLPNLERTGYTFKGWTDGENTFNGEVTWESGATSVTLTAVWEKTSDMPDFTFASNAVVVGGGTEKTCIVTEYTGSDTVVAIPDCVTSIGTKAFYHNAAVVSVTFGEDSRLTSIGASAFIGCASLKSIVVPEGVTSIGNYAFADCTLLASVTLPDGLTTIGTYAFRNCTSLESIVIPDSVETIGSCAFYGCTSLASVTIGKVIPTIQAVAFYDCNISTVYYKGTESDWSTYSAKIGSDNDCLTGATRYYYSETEPAVNGEGAYDGNFWHYADGVPSVWKK